MKTRYFVRNMGGGHLACWRKIGNKIEYKNTVLPDNRMWRISSYESLRELRLEWGKLKEFTPEEFALLF